MHSTGGRQVNISKRMKLLVSRHASHDEQRIAHLHFQTNDTDLCILVSICSLPRSASLTVTLHYTSVPILAAFQAMRVTDADLSGGGGSCVISSTNIIIIMCLLCVHRALFLRLRVLLITWAICNVPTLQDSRYSRNICGHSFETTQILKMEAITELILFYDISRLAEINQTIPCWWLGSEFLLIR
jgi:hypothetical protein